MPSAVVDRILELRDHPPAHLQRVPGPKAILYFLHRDTELRATGLPLPRSTATVWQLLRRHGRVVPRRPAAHEPWDLPDPLTSWQLDFKDATLKIVGIEGLAALALHDARHAADARIGSRQWSEASPASSVSR